MSFAGLRIYFDGFLVRANGLLQIGRIFRSLFGTSGLLPERDGVVVVSERVGRLVAHEAREFLLGTGQRIGSGLFHLAKKKIGSGIGRLQIGCIADAARGIGVGTAGVKGGAESREHSRRLRMRSAAFGEDFGGGFDSSME